MKKIMFNDRYGLTQAVLNGRKTMTRRIVPVKYVPLIDDGHLATALTEAQRHGDAYRIGEIVAVAQAYKNVFHPLDWVNRELYGEEKGWNNKMFVRADLMPNQIQMKGIRIEKLQAIQNDDCMKEGIRIYTTGIPQCKTLVGGILEFIPPYGFDDYHHKHFCNFDSPREAFAALINKRGVGRPGLWELNPWVFAYEYVLRRPAAEHGCRMEGGGLKIEK